MNEHVHEVFRRLDRLKRQASIAEIGGFRPPVDPVTSWFGGQGVGLAGEGLPMYQERELFPLLQVKTEELPYVPEALATIKFFILFLDREAIPFDQPHGAGWMIREYKELSGLQPLPAGHDPPPVRPFPIRWHLAENEFPGWEDTWDLVDLTAINESAEASAHFFDHYRNHSGTKIGGYPTEIQHRVGLEDYVFQVGSEEKARWNWVDNGIGYFFQKSKGDWQFSCQFY